MSCNPTTEADLEMWGAEAERAQVTRKVPLGTFYWPRAVRHLVAEVRQLRHEREQLRRFVQAMHTQRVLDGVQYGLPEDVRKAAGPQAKAYQRVLDEMNRS